MNTIDLLQLTQEQKYKGVWLSGIEGEGERLEWRNNGQLWEKAFYKNNKLHGKYLTWYENGQLWIKSFYKNNKKHGERLIWYYNGKLRKKAFYENGIRISYEYP